MLDVEGTKTIASPGCARRKGFEGSQDILHRCLVRDLIRRSGCGKWTSRMKVLESRTSFQRRGREFRRLQHADRSRQIALSNFVKHARSQSGVIGGPRGTW
jgi:hypothetical protein